MVGWVSNRLQIRLVIVSGAIAMAIAPEVIWTGLVFCLVNVSYAFMLNSTSAELGNAVDRAGMSCYSAVYAVYNIAYSIGMMATTVSASLMIRRLGFLGVLRSVTFILILCTPLLLRMDSTPVVAPELAPAEK